MKRHAIVRAVGALVLLAAVAVAAGCSQTETSAEASPSPQAAGARPPDAVGGSGEPITLEFDVPEEFRSQPAGAASGVTGFRVGFFRTGNAAPARTLDVARNTLTLRDRTARVTLPRDALAECGSGCVIRVQSVSGDRASAWSAPVSLAPGAAARQTPAPPARPEQPRTARPERPRDTPREPRGLTAADVERYPALLEALRTLLPADTKLETELAKFRRLPDLALVVAISRQQDIPFTALSKVVQGPPRATPANALSTVRPDLDARSALRKARAEARRLIQAPPQ